MIGSRLGPYRLVSRLGSGGMGEVYLATDERLHRDVALKILPAGAPEDDGARDRLRREAITLSQLNHPHVAAVYDVGIEGDRDYVVLEYVSGGTLAELVATGPLPLARVLQIAIEIAEGLEAAHEHGIVHRDLKPANIALDSRGQVKILDFGIAGFVADRALLPTGLAPTLGLGPIGTLPYMAPEQLRAEPTDGRTDLYALGALLHEMATGQRPFSAANSAVAIATILHAPPIPLRTLDSRLPPPLEDIVSRLLAKKPGGRPASATRVLVDLRRLAQESQSHWAPLRRGWAGIGLAIAIIGLVLIAGFALRGRGTGGSVRPASGSHTSIVIFPLEVLGGDRGSAYLGRAFAEAVTVNLAQRAEFEVIPVPAGVAIAGDGAAGLIRSARKLGADRAVSGSLLRQESELRATIQLVDARRNRLEWGRQYTIDPSDVGASANDLARELSSRLGVSETRMYEYFRYEGGTPEMASWPGLPATIAALRRHDPGHGLALTESLLVLFPHIPEAHVMRLVALVDQDNRLQGSLGARQAVFAGLEALEKIDPHNPTIPITRAAYLGNADYVSGREREADYSLSQVLSREDLRPGLRSQALRYRATARAKLGRRTDARVDMEKAIHQDPANPYNYIFLAGLLAREDQHEAALQRFREAVAIDPGFNDVGLVSYLERAGLIEQALEASAELCRTRPSATRWAFRARLLAEHGPAKEARTSIARARAFPRTGETEFALARAAGFLGDKPQALAALGNAVALGFRSTDLGSDSAFVTLWNDPGFRGLTQRARPDPTDFPRNSSGR